MRDVAQGPFWGRVGCYPWRAGSIECVSGEGAGLLTVGRWLLHEILFREGGVVNR